MKKKNKIILPLFTSALIAASTAMIPISLTSCVEQNEDIPTTKLNQQAIDELYNVITAANIQPSITTINEANQIMGTLKNQFSTTINVPEQYFKSITALNNSTVQVLFNNDVLISEQSFKTTNWENVLISRNSILLTKTNMFKNDLIKIDQPTANKLYDVIFGSNQIQFGLTTMQNANTLLNANKNNIENSLSLITNSINTIDVPNTDSIVITFNGDLLQPNSVVTDNNRNSIIVASTTNTITLTKPGMFAQNLKSLNEQQAIQIYDSIFGTGPDQIQFNQITKETAQPILNNKLTSIENLLSIPSNSIVAITATDTNNITIYFNNNLFNQATYTTGANKNSVTISINQNYISLTKENMFLPSLIQFNQYNIENLYYSIFGIDNNKIPFSNLTVAEANKRLPNLKNSIENTIGALPNSITSIQASQDNITIVFNANIFIPFNYSAGIDLNSVVFNIIANQIKITKTGMFTRDLISVNQAMADNLYNSIFGNNPDQIVFGKTSINDAANKLTKLKNAIANVLNIGVDAIDKTIVVDKNSMIIEFNTRLFNHSIVNTSTNNNSIKMTIDVNKITLTKPNMLADNPPTFSQAVANRIYDSLFNKNAFSYGVTTVQEANIKLNQLRTNIEAAIGLNAKIKSISIPTNDKIEISLSTPNIYPNNTIITSADKNSVTMSFDVDKIQIIKPGMFNTTPAQFIPQIAQSISDAIFNLGQINLGMNINDAMNNLENNKKQISDSIIQTVAGSIMVNDIWVVNQNLLQIKLTNNPFANNSTINVVDTNNNQYTLGSVNDSNNSYIYLQSNDNNKPLFNLIQLTKQKVIEYYNLLNSKLAINGTNSKSNANGIYNRAENKQQVSNIFNIPIKYIKSIGVYNSNFDLWLYANVFGWTGTVDFGADVNNNKTEYLVINYSNKPQGQTQQTLRVQNYTNRLFS